MKQLEQDIELSDGVAFSPFLKVRPRESFSASEKPVKCDTRKAAHPFANRHGKGTDSFCAFCKFVDLLEDSGCLGEFVPYN